MSSQAPLIIKLVASCTRIIRQAGKIIQEVYEDGNLKIVEKAAFDYQTEADRRAQICIVASLKKQFPDVRVIAEEEEPCSTITTIPDEWVVEDYDSNIINTVTCPPELQNIVPDEVTVWVDPLDGTSEFTKGFLNHVTILIGIAVNDKAVAGVIHQPFYSEEENPINYDTRTIWGIVGVGTGDFKHVQPPKDRRILVTTKSHHSSRVELALNSIKADEVIRVGGTGCKVLYLIDGKAHAYIYTSFGTKKWDTCAPEAILRACGGILTDSFGNVYPYHGDVGLDNRTGIIATAPGENHSFYISNMPEELKCILK